MPHLGVMEFSNHEHFVIATLIMLTTVENAGAGRLNVVALGC